MFTKKTSAVTLIELLIAISLLGLVILSTTSVEMFARKQMKTTDMQTQLLNEVSPAIEHIVKNISLGIGDKNDPGIKVYPTGKAPYLQIRQDINKTPSDYSDDIWCEYKSNSFSLPDAPSIRYDPNINDGNSDNYQVIVRKVTDFTFALVDTNNNGIATDDNLVQFSVTVRKDPTKAIDPINNPEVTIYTQAIAGSMSIS